MKAVLFLETTCQSLILQVAIKLTKNILILLQIIGPIILIGSLVYSFIQMTINPDDKKIPKKIINKFIAAIVLFFLPTIMNATMGLLGSTFIISDCWNAKLEVSYNPDYIKTTDNDKLKKSFLTNPSEYEHGNKKEDTSSSDGSTTTATGKGNFVKYSMSDQQLKQITALALHEQGTTKGAAAEASLMANRFEMYGSKYGTGSAGLVNYVRSSGWFANAATHMADFGVVTSAAYSAVKQVLVEGKRTLPKYVDEHDCFSDLSSVTNNGSAISITNRSSYKKNVSKIHNRYGATYTFYSFPASGSDPFGYTSESNRQKYGDDCYSID